MLEKNMGSAGETELVESRAGGEKNKESVRYYW